MVWAAGTPGSGDDPLVSKSYVDNLVNDWTMQFTALQTRMDALLTQVSTLQTKLDTSNAQIVDLQSALQTTGGFRLKKLSTGQTLTVQPGGQVLMRTGRGTLMLPTGGGWVEIRTGRNMANGTPIVSNRLQMAVGTGGNLKALATCYVYVSGSSE